LFFPFLQQFCYIITSNNIFFSDSVHTTKTSHQIFFACTILRYTHHIKYFFCPPSHHLFFVLPPTKYIGTPTKTHHIKYFFSVCTVLLRHTSHQIFFVIIPSNSFCPYHLHRYYKTSLLYDLHQIFLFLPHRHYKQRNEPIFFSRKIKFVTTKHQIFLYQLHHYSELPCSYNFSNNNSSGIKLLQQNLLHLQVNN
jgi:hypothetical protein